MSESFDRGVVEDYGRFWEFSAGMWAWILHKFTGWILAGYLFAHVAVMSAAIPAASNPDAIVAGTDVYTQTLQQLEGIFLVRVLELGLLAVAVFHILNGIRLLLIDLGIGLDVQDQTFYASLIFTALITIASVPTFVTPEVIPW